MSSGTTLYRSVCSFRWVFRLTGITSFFIFLSLEILWSRFSGSEEKALWRDQRASATFGSTGTNRILCFFRNIFQMYGCRVIQKALESIDEPQQLEILKEMEGQVWIDKEDSLSIELEICHLRRWSLGDGLRVSPAPGELGEKLILSFWNMLKPQYNISFCLPFELRYIEAGWY